MYKKNFLSLSCFVAAAALQLAPVHAQPSQTPKAVAATASAPRPAPPISYQVPAPETLLVMTRSSILALSQANEANNYAVLWNLGSSEFRAKNTLQSLSDAFQIYRKNNISFDPVVALEPKFTEAAIFQSKYLRINGYFPSQPLRVVFQLSYVAENGKWKLSDIRISLPKSDQ